MVFNLAANASIQANATCGQQEEPETYCKLVEHVRRRPNDKVQCGICHSRSNDRNDRHPISHAIDGTNSWWQSPTIQNGRQFHFVTITMDLKQVSESFCGMFWPIIIDVISQ